MNAIHQLLTDHIDIWTAADTEKKSGRGRSSGNGASVYGIKKLRELIQELAVRGKLIPQNDEWKKLKLSDLGFWAIGSGFPTSEQGSQNDDILFAKVSDMNLAGNEKFIVITNNTITNETAKRIKINVHSAGTVIFPKIGGAIATNKRRILTRDTAIDNNCLGLTPKAGVSTDWLYLLLSSIDLTKYQAGTSVPALAQKVLQEIPVMLPELSEQHPIVAKVDELMTLCDQLETQHSNAAEAHEKLVSHLLGTLTQSQSAEDFSVNWQRIAAHFDTLFTTEASIDALKQTLLQLAVMGKLVQQDSNDEPASELLKRIQVEKAKLIAEGIIKKDKPLPPITEEEKPFDLPNGWEWPRLDELSQIGTGATPLRTKPEYFNPAVISWVTSGETSSPYIFKTEQYVSPLALKETNLTVYPKGTLVVAMYGQGKTRGQITELMVEACTNQACASIRLFSPDKLHRKYVKYFFEKIYDEIRELAAGGAQPNLNLSKVKETLLPLPPLAEQHRIVAKVDELMAICNQLKSRITEANQLQQKLADVLVEQALS